MKNFTISCAADLRYSCNSIQQSGNGRTIHLGNVFVSTGAGTVLEYTPTGTLVQTLNVGTSYITGSTFDQSGNFYVTRFANNAVQKFDSNGNNLGTFGGGYSTPESVVVDASGNIYVGSLGAGIPSSTRPEIYCRRIYISTRIDFMDLAGDQTTMLYTQEGGEVHRVNLGTRLYCDFSTAVENAYALRIRSDGTVLVADGLDIELLTLQEQSEPTIQRATMAGSASTWTPTDILRSADFGGHVAHFDIASGAVLNSWDIPGVNGTWGLAIYGEITEGGGGGGNGTEPSPSLALLGIGLAGLGAMRRRKSA